jgi:hypothetical protein
VVPMLKCSEHLREGEALAVPLVTSPLCTTAPHPSGPKDGDQGHRLHASGLLVIKISLS